MTLKWMTTRELVGRPGAALKSLPRDGAALITVNGKPRALLLAVDEKSFMEDVTSLFGFFASQGARRARQNAAATGHAALTDADIDGVVTKARADRRRGR